MKINSEILIKVLFVCKRGGAQNYSFTNVHIILVCQE